MLCVLPVSRQRWFSRRRSVCYPEPGLASNRSSVERAPSDEPYPVQRWWSLRALPPPPPECHPGALLNELKPRVFNDDGADDRDRTGDRQLGRLPLYQLSYVRMWLGREDSNLHQRLQRPPCCQLHHTPAW